MIGLKPCVYNSMFSISFRKHRGENNENNLLTLIIKMLIFLARAIITPIARASSVFLSTYGNTIFNQSTRVLSWDSFLLERIDTLPRAGRRLHFTLFLQSCGNNVVNSFFFQKQKGLLEQLEGLKVSWCYY